MHTKKLVRRLTMAVVISGLVTLAGCLATTSGGSYGSADSGPAAYEYFKQAEAKAEQKQWNQASILAQRAAQRARADGLNHYGLAAHYMSNAAMYQENDGDTEMAKNIWLEAADSAHKAANYESKNKDNFLNSNKLSATNSLSQSAYYLSRTGQSELAKTRWKEAADMLQQHFT